MNKNSKNISGLFVERSKLALIGLTGRAGSGCTSAANIQEIKSPNFQNAASVKCYDNNIYAGHVV
jgi:hypothetical protein